MGPSPPAVRSPMTEYLSFHLDLTRPEAVASYDELPLWSAMAGLLLLRHVPLGRETRALDVGCGTGFPLLELAQRLGPGATVTGIDPWGAALERARRKAEAWGVRNVEIVEGDAGAMPFAEGAFSLVVSNLGLNNFADPAAALAECSRVLRPGGRLALTSNLRGHMGEFYEVFASVLRERGDADALERLDEHVRQRSTVARISALLAGAGFAVERVEEEPQVMRFADGGALLRHHFVKLGFLGGWKGVVDEDDRPEVFAAVEAALDRVAEERGGLELAVPLAYVEAARGE